MTLRVNRRKISVAEYEKRLNQNGMDALRLWNGALELAQPVAVDRLPGFTQGLVSVQDAGAQLAAPLLDVHDGMRVLDACAAPGGKSAHLLELAKVELTALDNDSARVARIAENLSRLELDIHRIIRGDAAHPAEWWDGKQFDRILADVPCSASGVVCRHPDIKWLRRESDLSRFGEKQREILDALWQILTRDGKLLYATCSVFAEENKLQVEKFLRHHSDARLLPLSQVETIDGQLLPNSHHDGFFYALLHKA
jgi:16S rRNA (cytosine967-C5)-methyltransferase